MSKNECNCRQPGLGGDCDGSCTQSPPKPVEAKAEIYAQSIERKARLGLPISLTEADNMAAEFRRLEARVVELLHANTAEVIKRRAAHDLLDTFLAVCEHEAEQLAATKPV